MDVPKDQFSTLLEHGLYSSAQILGCFAVSSTSINPETSPHLKSESLVQFGEALFREKEYRRAIQAYKQALQYHKIIPKQSAATPPLTRSSMSASNRSSSPNSASISGINENEVKFKIATCHNSLSENRAALAEMEGIRSTSRNLEMNLMMAKLYRNSRHTRSAIGCYKECLRQCPFIIEAITALAELGVAAKDIISLFPQTPNRSGRPPFDHFDSSRWLQRYVEAQCCIVSNDYKGGLELFTELLQRFPNNIHILLEMAKVKAVIGKNDEAILDFEKVRSIDPYVVTYMDEYAMLLKLKSDISKLNKLVHDILSVDPTRPEVFVALSVLWEKKDERGALSYAEKSIRIDERHVAGYIMKGNLFLSMNQPEAAVVAYRGAQELRPDLRSYQGLVRSYLALAKIKEALHAAREAMKAMPQSAKALKLVGDVHASSTSGREKAKKFYESALRLEPGFLGAALALAELHVMEGRNGDAVSLLERYLKDWADDSLHVKLAQVFAATNMLQEGLLHYQAALRINDQNEAAKKGLERLEKQMKVCVALITHASINTDNICNGVSGIIVSFLFFSFLF
ncbi:anaphase-promoting complex subunit 7 [Olea europaea subsp. europaea]|uniref:Anaphase-promoting complex subunit 7 n=2 Tax=Olea europaea subsp. europaea TaxID=158383 RepID=A0A8S0UPV4_OLEEU|nr:anaphase-promoting complex subunit 7 [Olea europaea subsp. europaea]